MDHGLIIIRFKIARKVQLRQKGVIYNFKLTTSTAATISVGSTSNIAGDSNFIYCDPSKTSSYYVSYTSTTIQKVDIEISLIQDVHSVIFLLNWNGKKPQKAHIMILAVTI